MPSGKVAAAAAAGFGAIPGHVGAAPRHLQDRHGRSDDRSARPFMNQDSFHGLVLRSAHWFEKSESLVAPIIGHKVGDVVECALIVLMVAVWL
jgi:hypothetical protein